MIRQLFRAATIASLLVCAVSCGRNKPVPLSPPFVQIDPTTLNGETAMSEVASFVALGPRESGTAGALAAATHIADRLRKFGMEPLVEEFADICPRGTITFRNVIGIIDGPTEDTVILGSHYDTRSGIAGDFVGANDSGSSTGLLLELARICSSLDWTGPDLVFAFFDGEECMKKYSANDGLHGSRQLANSLVRNQTAAKVKAVIILDMIGDSDLNVEIPHNSHAGLRQMLLEAATEEGARLKFGHTLSNILDDHQSFLSAGMPAIDIIDFKYGSQPGKNDYWHTAEDTMDKLSPASLQTVGRVVIRLLNRLAE